jgi:hypothetical protein
LQGRGFFAHRRICTPDYRCPKPDQSWVRKDSCTFFGIQVSFNFQSAC